MAKVLAGAFAAQKVIAGGKAIVKSASDMQQAIGATETVYGKYSKNVIKNSGQAAKAFGLSKTEFMENSNLIGALLTNQGVSQDKLAGKTKSLIGVSADLAATFGGPTSDAVEALNAAFKGEFDSLEKYGISLKQSTINTEALKVANVKTTAEFNKLSTARQTAAKRQATENLLMKQTKKTRGAFAKETGTLAHQQQVLAAQFENVKAKLGTFLLPVLTKVFGYINDKVMPVVSKFIDQMRTGKGAGGKFAEKMRELGQGLKDLGNWIKEKVWPWIKKLVSYLIDHKEDVAKFGVAIAGVAVALKGISKVNGAVGVIQGLTKAGPLLANPYVAGAVAIAALAGGLFLLYKNNPKFKAFVDNVASAFKEKFVPAIQPAIDIVKNQLLPAWQRLSDWTVKNWPTIQRVIMAVVGAIAQGIGSFVTGIAQLVGGVVKVVSGFITVIKGIIHGDWKQVWKGFKQIASGAWEFVKGVFKTAGGPLAATIRNVIGSLIKKAWNALWKWVTGKTSDAWNDIKKKFSDAKNAVVGKVQDLWNGVKKFFSDGKNRVTSTVSDMWSSVKQRFSDGKARVLGYVSELPGRIKGYFASAGSWLISKGGQVMSGLLHGITGAWGRVTGFLSDIGWKVLRAVGSTGDLLYGAGQAIISGLWNGMKSLAGDAIAYMRNVASDIASAAKSVLHIHSPSRVMHQIGIYVMQGLANGMSKGRATVKAVTKKVTSDITKAMTAELKTRIAAMRKRVKDGRRETRYAKQMTATFKRYTAIRIRSIGNETRALTRNAKARELVYKRLDGAKKRLADIKKASADYAKSVKDATIAFANITSLGDENGAITTDGIVTALATKVKQAKSFAALLAKLNKAGLNKSTYNQLVQAGAESGYDTAKALAAGVGKGTIKQVNSLQAQLSKSAVSLGKATAKRMYGAGIQAAQGLVNGLNRKKKALEKAAGRLGRAMANAVKKALKIKSPSRVFKDIGVYTVAGLTKGLGDRTALKNVKRAASGMTRSIESGYKQPSLALAAPAKSGGNTYEITVNAPVGSSSADIGRELTKHISAYERQGGRKRA